MTDKRIKVAIVGAAGYTAGELIRILVNHPNVDLGGLVSQSMAGKSVDSVHHDLFQYHERVYTESLIGEFDVIFLCIGHGKSRSWVESYQGKARIIDLSQDFRHSETAGEFVYGLPEYQREKIISAKNIANPGCFATAIQLALLPIADAFGNADIHVHGVTGSTGAGQSPTPTSHFSWRNNNVSLYKVFNHQHLIEIRETLGNYGKKVPDIFFVPMRGNFTRGIFITAYMRFDGEESELIDKYRTFYESAPYTHVSTAPLHLKQVINTNHCLLHIMVKEGQLVVTSIIDNLVKGASGQAVQNMNLMFGLPEDQGLHFKASYF